MTIEEYRSMENQTIEALRHLREIEVSRNDIGILMSREVYERARASGGPAYAVGAENYRALYWGYDVYVINEAAPPTFSPTLIRFPAGCDPNQLNAGTFFIFESDGTLCVYSKSAQEQALFCETGFTVHQAYQTERVAFADWASQPAWNDFEQQFNRIAAIMRCESGNTVPKMKKATSVKDWDERITLEDTKELDEFLSSLVKKGTLESAT